MYRCLCRGCRTAMKTSTSRGENANRIIVAIIPAYPLGARTQGHPSALPTMYYTFSLWVLRSAGAFGGTWYIVC